jgi:WD40 repeat protein
MRHPQFGRAASLTLIGLGVVMLIASGAGARQTAGRLRLGSRFLITTAPLPLGAPERLEIVARGGRLIRLVAGLVGPAALSPNHKLIAWAGKGGIHVENVTGSKARLAVRVRCPTRTKGGKTIGVCGTPFVWSPDSRKLLFVKANKGLAVASLSTGAIHEVVPPQKHVTYFPVAWSGPAHQILFTANNAGAANGIGCCSATLVIARPSGVDQRTLYSAVDAIHDNANASWSPNGKWISFTTDGRGSPRDPRLAVVTAATGSTKRIGYNGYTTAPIWSPDSTRFTIGGYQTPIGIYSASGSKIGSLKPTSASPTVWTPGGIYIVPGSQAPRQLLFIPNGQHTARPVFTLPKSQILNTVQPF